jgi:type II restriction enzyme
MVTSQEITALELYTELVENFKIKEKIGSVEIKLGNVKAKYNGKDAIGDLLQEWLGEWMKSKKYYFRTKVNTQEFPDFLLHTTDEKGLLEVKTFNAEATPAFDIANFSSYSKSLLVIPERLDADYLIFSYKMENSELSVDNIWLKKVWEIAGTSGANPICLQTKDKQPYNIRPVKWFSEKAKNKPFTSKLEFVTAISQTHEKYNVYTKSYNKNWLKIVSEKYFKNTGIKL